VLTLLAVVARVVEPRPPLCSSPRLPSVWLSVGCARCGSPWAALGVALGGAALGVALRGLPSVWLSAGPSVPGWRVTVEVEVAWTTPIVDLLSASGG